MKKFQGFIVYSVEKQIQSTWRPCWNWHRREGWCEGVREEVEYRNDKVSYGHISFGYIFASTKHKFFVLTRELDIICTLCNMMIVWNHLTNEKHIKKNYEQGAGPMEAAFAMAFATFSSSARNFIGLTGMRCLSTSYTMGIPLGRL